MSGDERELTLGARLLARNFIGATAEAVDEPALVQDDEPAETESAD